MCNGILIVRLGLSSNGAKLSGFVAEFRAIEEVSRSHNSCVIIIIIFQQIYYNLPDKIAFKINNSSFTISNLSCNKTTKKELYCILDILLAYLLPPFILRCLAQEYI